LVVSLGLLFLAAWWNGKRLRRQVTLQTTQLLDLINPYLEFQWGYRADLITNESVWSNKTIMRLYPSRQTLATDIKPPLWTPLRRQLEHQDIQLGAHGTASGLLGRPLCRANRNSWTTKALQGHPVIDIFSWGNIFINMDAAMHANEKEFQPFGTVISWGVGMATLVFCAWVTACIRKRLGIATPNPTFLLIAVTTMLLVTWLVSSWCYHWVTNERVCRMHNALEELVESKLGGELSERYPYQLKYNVKPGLIYGTTSYVEIRHHIDCQRVSNTLV